MSAADAEKFAAAEPESRDLRHLSSQPLCRFPVFETGLKRTENCSGSFGVTIPESGMKRTVGCMFLAIWISADFPFVLLPWPLSSAVVNYCVVRSTHPDCSGATIKSFWHLL